MHAVLNSALPIFTLILTGFICGHFGSILASHVFAVLTVSLLVAWLAPT
jgi:malonate transporter and related proteins